MNRNDYLQLFEKQILGEVTNIWLSATLRDIAEHKEMYIKELLDSLYAFMDNISKMQVLQPIPVGLITLSLMRTSILEEKPTFRIDAYDEKQEYGRNLAYQYEEIPWFLDAWKQYEQDLIRGVASIHGERFIRGAQIRQYMSKSISRLLVMLRAYLKYDFLDFDRSDSYKNLLKDSYFVLSIGEYMDKQVALFASIPEEDIVLSPEKSAAFQHFHKKIYRNKSWKDVSWERSCFEDCEFSKCTFQNVDMKDARFIHCLFREDSFTEGDLCGAVFENCVFRHLNMENMRFHWEPSLENEVFDTDIYRDTFYLHCTKDDEIDNWEGQY